MRARFIHPSIFESMADASLSHGARLLFIGLIARADDMGRGRASPRALAGAIFPGERVSVAKVRAWRDEVAAAGFVRLYESDGTAYFDIPKFSKYQPMRYKRKSQVPPFQQHPHFLQSSAKTSVGIGIGTGIGTGTGTETNKGEPGSPDRVSRPTYPDPFDAFWKSTSSEWPKGSKPEALKEWSKLPREDQAALEASYASQAAYKRRESTQGNWVAPFPHLARWIKHRRFEEEVPTGPSKVREFSEEQELDFERRAEAMLSRARGES